MSSNPGNGKLVCVTGASGFIASWLVKLLLLRGYTVNGTVRDLNNSRKVNHLFKLDGAKERLHLFEANLLEEGSFGSAVKGCEGVFHTASPVVTNVTDPQVPNILKLLMDDLKLTATSSSAKHSVLDSSNCLKNLSDAFHYLYVFLGIQLIDPAVKGTLNILKLCAKSPSVKRVVLTSSMVAVLYNEKPRNPEVVVDETWFSNPNFCMESELWYALSKTLAEDAAWKFAKENNIDMVAINPSFVIGPLLQPFLNETSAAILKLINGAQTLPRITGGWINVKDVTNAHIQAFEIPTANGRYCLVESVADYSDVSKILHEMYPTLELPEECLDCKASVPKYQVSKQKARTLGIEFIPLDVGLKEIVGSLKEKNFINF